MCALCQEGCQVQGRAWGEGESGAGQTQLKRTDWGPFALSFLTGHFPPFLSIL